MYKTLISAVALSNEFKDFLATSALYYFSGLMVFHMQLVYLA